MAENTWKVRVVQLLLCFYSMGTTTTQDGVHFLMMRGHEALPHSAPWLVSLRRGNYHNFGHVCGGSILDMYWIVTAAHCVNNLGGKSNFKVVVGSHTRNYTEPSAVVHEIAEIIEHENFNRSSMQFDIALLRLEVAIVFNQQVAPVLLPSEPRNVPSCKTTGWGQTLGTGDHRLQEVDVTMFPPNFCRRRAYRRMYTDTMICAGQRTRNQGPCLGDSGGPLVCREDAMGEYYLYGVTSFARPCNLTRARHIAIYTRITSFIDWIKGKSRRSKPHVSSRCVVVPRNSPDTVVTCERIQYVGCRWYMIDCTDSHPVVTADSEILCCIECSNLAFRATYFYPYCPFITQQQVREQAYC